MVVKIVEEVVVFESGKVEAVVGRKMAGVRVTALAVLLCQVASIVFFCLRRIIADRGCL